MYLYNTLTRKKEEFKPIKPPQVGMYTCGPTVYDFAHLGNYRTFIFEDFLRRVLEFNGYTVKHVMNITDVGHLTSDADTGEDKLERGAKREGRSVWEIAEQYTQAFMGDLDKLNIKRAHILPKATEHILEQVDLIERLEKKGLTYQTSTGVYFDTLFYENKGFDYSVLSGQKLEEMKAGARAEVVVDQEKKHPADFALWLFTVGDFSDHVMRWNSPWGEGFPGWHLECSVMSEKYLGQPFDIHAGGEDHIAIHHTNEIAQSRGAYEKPLANYWLHGRFMLVEGRRMGKSEGNAFLVGDLEKRGFAPLAFRYLCLSTHYRTPLNFTWEALEGAQRALERLEGVVVSSAETIFPRYNEVIKSDALNKYLERRSKSKRVKEVTERFLRAINDDLNMPQALAVVWDLVKGGISAEDKVATLLKFDQVLSLRLDEVKPLDIEIPDQVQTLADQREELRQKGEFLKADKLREKILDQGFLIEDTPQGPKVKKV